MYFRPASIRAVTVGPSAIANGSKKKLKSKINKLRAWASTPWSIRSRRLSWVSDFAAVPRRRSGQTFENIVPTFFAEKKYFFTKIRILTKFCSYSRHFDKNWIKKIVTFFHFCGRSQLHACGYSACASDESRVYWLRNCLEYHLPLNICSAVIPM